MQTVQHFFSALAAPPRLQLRSEATQPATDAAGAHSKTTGEGAVYTMTNPICKHLVHLLDTDFDNGVTGAEALAITLMGAALRGNCEAFEILMRALEAYDEALDYCEMEEDDGA
jgi:hypothetical protein